METPAVFESMLKQVQIIKQKLEENAERHKHLNKVLEGAYAELRHVYNSHFYKQYG